jgi:hypothetical protein
MQPFRIACPVSVDYLEHRERLPDVADLIGEGLPVQHRLDPRERARYREHELEEPFGGDQVADVSIVARELVHLFLGRRHLDQRLQLLRVQAVP